MAKYTNINEALDRINRAILALEADIREWDMLKSNLFEKTRKKSPNEQEKELQSEFDSFLERSRKVRDNLLIFKRLFENVSLN
jgi:hypothetical protein